VEALIEHLIRLLLTVGPWIVLVATFVETAFFVGLIIPAEATVLLAAALADAGKFSLTSVFVATFVGALLGDQTGYLLGRMGGNRVIAREGAIARLWHKYEPVSARLFRRHAASSVSIARFISFVRTLMPWFAGMSRMHYGRFLAYDLIGVLGWSVASIALGYAAGESWRAVADVVGSLSAYVIAAILTVLAVVAVFKRLHARANSASRPPELLRVALTGNVASGKSTVSAIWRELGAAVIDADVLARTAVEPGTQTFQRVVDEFGDAIVKDGSIDRRVLRSLVFADEEKRKRLEAIVHPEVARLRQAEEARLAAAGERIVVNDIPLLFEVGMENEFDVVVVVDAPSHQRIARMVETRGLTAEEAAGMVAAQMPAHEKRLPATYVIDNDGTLAELRAKAQQVWTEIANRIC
jgi:dephospho-CoA kinase